MRDIVERLELQAFVADKIQSGMKPLIMDCLEEITHLRCQYEALLNQAEMNARLLTENAELRERLAEADEANRRVSDENEKLRKALKPFAAYAKQTPIIYEHHGIRMVLVQQDLLKRLCQDAAAAIRESGE